MKYMVIIILGIALMTGCKKNTCIQCTREIPVTYENTPQATVDSLVSTQYCGRQADSALSSSDVISSSFVVAHGIVPYSCFYTN